MNQDHIIKCGKDQNWIGLAAQESSNRLIEWPGPLTCFHIIGPFPPEGGFVRTPRTPPGYGPAHYTSGKNTLTTHQGRIHSLHIREEYTHYTSGKNTLTTHQGGIHSLHIREEYTHYTSGRNTLTTHQGGIN